jgi:hypothetical protein
MKRKAPTGLYKPQTGGRMRDFFGRGKWQRHVSVHEWIRRQEALARKSVEAVEAKQARQGK